MQRHNTRASEAAFLHTDNNTAPDYQRQNMAELRHHVFNTSSADKPGYLIPSKCLSVYYNKESRKTVELTC